MTERLRRQQEKYYHTHRQFKVYLSTEEDADIVEKLMKCKNKSILIRNALILYFRKGG